MADACRMQLFGAVVFCFYVDDGGISPAPGANPTGTVPAEGDDG